MARLSQKQVQEVETCSHEKTQPHGAKGGKEEKQELKYLIVGDLHGCFHRLERLIRLTSPDVVFQLGDFGYWPKEEGDLSVDYNEKLNPHMLSFSDLDNVTIPILFCDGNHEDFRSLYRCDNEHDGVIQEFKNKNVKHMKRGSTYELPDGRIILFVGGALSVDKHLRTEGKDWFDDETITNEQICNILDNVKKADIIFSHTCPLEWRDKLSPSYDIPDFSNKCLSELLHTYKPSFWIHGHWHKIRSGKFKHGDGSTTKWLCLTNIENPHMKDAYYEFEVV